MWVSVWDRVTFSHTHPYPGGAAAGPGARGRCTMYLLANPSFCGGARKQQMEPLSKTRERRTATPVARYSTTSTTSIKKPTMKQTKGYVAQSLSNPPVVGMLRARILRAIVLCSMPHATACPTSFTHPRPHLISDLIEPYHHPFSSFGVMGHST